jgi:hypothetical protein
MSKNLHNFAHQKQNKLKIFKGNADLNQIISNKKSKKKGNWKETLFTLDGELENPKTSFPKTENPKRITGLLRRARILSSEAS